MSMKTSCSDFQTLAHVGPSGSENISVPGVRKVVLSWGSRVNITEVKTLKQAWTAKARGKTEEEDKWRGV